MRVLQSAPFQRRRLRSRPPDLRFWFGRRFRGRGWQGRGRLRLSRWAEPQHFCFQRAIGILPIRAAGFFVLGDVRHCSRLPGLGDRGFLRDFEDARLLFTCDGERLRVLIDGRNHAVEWSWPYALSGWRSGRRRSRLRRDRR
jgi:hypothetical protein